ncbi:MAG: phosphoribosylanthranilate isomerase [Paracoccaceae bacterium]
MQVKICGLKTHQSVAAAVDAGAAYLGFMFFPKSPRNIDMKTAAELVEAVPAGICKVALVVNANDHALDALLAVVPVDMLQLHGAESPERVAGIKQRFGLPVMKAVGISDESDLPKLDEYARVADQLLVDAKPPKGYGLPGGNGLTFDWRLIANQTWQVPWMLAGGLTPGNVAEAVHLTNAGMVDVSSGVESAAGVKDLDKIAAFVKAAKGAR